MGSYKARMIIREAKEEARRRFRRHRNKNRLAVPGIHQCIIVLDGLKPSFNIGKIFRSSEAFGCHEVHLIGTSFFDPAPAMGAFKYVPAKFHNRFITCYAQLLERGYTPFILEPGQGAPVMDVDLPEKSAFVFGHEEFGLSFEPVLFPEIRRLTIPQYGRSQSLNVSVAASIILYEYTRQFACRELETQAIHPCKEKI